MKFLATLKSELPKKLQQINNRTGKGLLFLPA